MDARSAKEKLDHVIAIGRVEMYKPIQIAEVLRVARTSNEVDLSSVESYRTKSRRWRDEVTMALFGKRSTSSARFQDDIWNESAVPPSAMVRLGIENGPTGVVEAYIYNFIIDKNQEIASARSKVPKIRDVNDVTNLLSDFDSPTLTSSADRLYEILATAVFKSELSQAKYTFSIDRPHNAPKGLAVDNLVDLVATVPMPLIVDRLGHTNAADAGLDIWTNFGVAVNVKRRVLTPQLLEQIVEDTKIGSLHVVCLDVEQNAAVMLKKLRASGMTLSITTKSDLLGSIQRLLSKQSYSELFVETLLDAFDKEFPMARTLLDFVESRGYSNIPLSGLWRNPGT